ncbi:MAG TPA: VOC family protein [Polyangia bacterium]|jgi:catechol 2,3-dioxygenase-like lactoylglutathione lyase family enzyme
MEAEIIGIDHIYLSVRSVERSEAFYDRVLLAVLGFRKNNFTIGGDGHVQYFNRLFGVVLRPARQDTRAHDPYGPGLHHLCLRVEGSVDVDRVAAALVAAGMSVSEPKLFPEYAPDYYAAFITDPDGLRLEITNFRAERRARMEVWECAG